MENGDYRFYGNYDLNDEALKFNWENTQLRHTDHNAKLLAEANEKMEQIGEDELHEEQDRLWLKICDEAEE